MVNELMKWPDGRNIPLSIRQDIKHIGQKEIIIP